MSDPMVMVKEMHKTNAALLAQIETLKERLVTQSRAADAQVDKLTGETDRLAADLVLAEAATAEVRERLIKAQDLADSSLAHGRFLQARLDAFEEAAREAFTSLLRVMPEGAE